MAVFGKLILPEILKSVVSQLCVADGMLDVSVTHIVLNCPCVLPVVTELETGAMPEHMRMNRESNTGQFARTADHLPYI